MQREIKFRAWDKVNKKMFKVRAIDLVTGAICSSLSMDLENDDWKLPDSCILLQYSGQKDVNRKDICIADLIITHSGSMGVIKFEDGKFIIDFGSHCNDLTVESIRILQLKVIGNIFDNPELLKSK